MEKIKLNNQVVSMRKYVKQAKVHVINKLVKQIKFLQNRKGGEVQIKKAKRKAERFLEIVALVKKIKPDDVSKLALSKAKDWKDVLQQKNSALHDRCIAMLANYEAVQKEVEAFHNANAELVLEISSFFTQWEEKSKFSKDSPVTNKMSHKRNISKTNLNEESSEKSNLKMTVKTKTESNVKKSETVFEMSREDENIDSEVKNSDRDINDKEKIAVVLKPDNDKSIRSREEIETKKLLPKKVSLKTNSSKDKSNKKHKFKTIIKTKIESDVEKTDSTFKVSHEDETMDSEAENSDIDVNDKEKIAVIKSDYDKPISSTEETNFLLNDKDNLMEVEELDNNNNEESESDENDDEEEIVDNSLNKKETKSSSDEESESNNIHWSILKPNPHLLKNNHAKNKLKAIALFNLNELDGLDEIPMSSVRNDECDQNESSEDEINETFQNKSSDPFFLGHDEEDSYAKESSDSNDSDANLRTTDSAHSFNHGSKSEKSNFHCRKQDQLRSRNFFQKYPYDHRNFPKSFKNGKNYEKSFMRENLASKNHHNKFQGKNMNKNKTDFKLKNNSYPLVDTYKKKPFKNISKDFGDGDNILVRNKVPYKKGNANQPLHPSWQAKKKQKDLLNSSFQGKRTVFNE